MLENSVCDVQLLWPRGRGDEVQGRNEGRDEGKVERNTSGMVRDAVQEHDKVRAQSSLVIKASAERLVCVCRQIKTDWGERGCVLGLERLADLFHCGADGRVCELRVDISRMMSLWLCCSVD